MQPLDMLIPPEHDVRGLATAGFTAEGNLFMGAPGTLIYKHNLIDKAALVVEKMMLPTNVFPVFNYTRAKEYSFAYSDYDLTDSTKSVIIINMLPEMYASNLLMPENKNQEKVLETLYGNWTGTTLETFRIFSKTYLANMRKAIGVERNNMLLSKYIAISIITKYVNQDISSEYANKLNCEQIKKFTYIVKSERKKDASFSDYNSILEYLNLPEMYIKTIWLE